MLAVSYTSIKDDGRILELVKNGIRILEVQAII
jgi:hypothetical protein